MLLRIVLKTFFYLTDEETQHLVEFHQIASSSSTPIVRQHQADGSSTTSTGMQTFINQTFSIKNTLIAYTLFTILY